MRHLFRAVDTPADAVPPTWKQWRGLLYVVAGALQRGVRRPFSSPAIRAGISWVLLLVGLVMQAVLLLVAGYLIDLGISLMELWAELARKHLELTL
jgi:hypothetical protein